MGSPTLRIRYVPAGEPVPVSVEGGVVRRQLDHDVVHVELGDSAAVMDVGEFTTWLETTPFALPKPTQQRRRP